MIGQFRRKNVFDGTPTSPHNLSSFQKIDSLTSIHSDSGKKAAVGCSKTRDIFPAKNSWRDATCLLERGSIMILSISKLLKSAGVWTIKSPWYTQWWSCSLFTESCPVCCLPLLNALPKVEAFHSSSGKGRNTSRQALFSLLSPLQLSVPAKWWGRAESCMWGEQQSVGPKKEMDEYCPAIQISLGCRVCGKMRKIWKYGVNSCTVRFHGDRMILVESLRQNTTIKMQQAGDWTHPSF